MGAMADPFKNLKSPAKNVSEPSPEPLAPIPVSPDPRVNDERVNTTRDGEGPLRWPPPKTLPEGGQPFKNMKG